jgi:hypothetical protein
MKEKEMKLAQRRMKEVNEHMEQLTRLMHTVQMQTIFSEPDRDDLNMIRAAANQAQAAAGELNRLAGMVELKLTE